MYKILKHGNTKRKIYHAFCEDCLCEFECDRDYIDCQSSCGSLICPECARFISNANAYKDIKTLTQEEYYKWQEQPAEPKEEISNTEKNKRKAKHKAGVEYVFMCKNCSESYVPNPDEIFVNDCNNIYSKCPKCGTENDIVVEINIKESAD